MKQTVSKNDFVDAFKQAGRQDDFSHAALIALHEYFKGCEEECGLEIELNVVAICCEFSEYRDLAEVQENYSDIENIEDLRDNTTVIEFSGGILTQN